MKIVLINTPYLDIYGPDKAAVANNFPLGIAYLAGYLRKNNHSPYLLDPEAQNLKGQELHEKISEINPDLIGLSCVTSTILTAKKIAKNLKKEFNVPIIIGGPHASAIPELVIENDKEFDIVVFGEGEVTLKEIADRLEKKENLKGCLGCFCRIDGKIIKNDPRPFIENVDTLPYPARDLLDISNYRPNNQTSIGKRSLSIFSGRGCPFHCVFCSTNTIMGYRFRAHSASYVVDEIQYLIDTYKVEHIAFKDDTFTVNKKRVYEICRLLKERKIKIPWTAHATVSTIDEELIKTMKDAGCFCLLFGIESGDDDVLKKAGKGTSIKQAENAIKLAHKYGIKILTSYIFGLPGETKESVENTINFSCAVPSTISMFFILVPYPGSKVYDNFKNENSDISDTNWKYFAHTSTHPLVKIEGLSEEEMMKLVGKAYLRFYARPMQIIRMLKRIRNLSEIKTYVRGGLGLFHRLIMIFKS